MMTSPTLMAQLYFCFENFPVPSPYTWTDVIRSFFPSYKIMETCSFGSAELWGFPLQVCQTSSWHDMEGTSRSLLDLCCLNLWKLRVVFDDFATCLFPFRFFAHSRPNEFQECLSGRREGSGHSAQRGAIIVSGVLIYWVLMVAVCRVLSRCFAVENDVEEDILSRGQLPP